MSLVIVSGEPRSGTSLTMDTLRILGVPVWGDEQPASARFTGDSAEDIARRKKARMMNPKFWELGSVVMQGLSVSRIRRRKDLLRSASIPEGERREKIEALDKFLLDFKENQNSAVKIVWSGLPRSDDSILRSSKLILVTRHPLHIAESQKNLESNIGVVSATEEGPAFVSPQLPLSSERYVRGAYTFLRWVTLPKNKGLDFLVVDYDDFFAEGAPAVDRIAEFIGRPLLPNAVSFAKANVDPSHRRSSEAEVPEGEEAHWGSLVAVYEMIREGEFEAAFSQLRLHLENQRNDPENAMWLDDESFWPLTPSLVRSMHRKPDLKKKMLEVRDRRLASGELCVSCTLFKKSHELQTVVTPSDMNDVVRPKIDCAEMGTVTLDECQQHWTRSRKDRVWAVKHTRKVSRG